MATKLDFDQFYASNKGLILKIIHEIQREFPHQMRDDIESLGYLWAWKCYEKLDESRAKFGTYFGNILRLRIIDHIRNELGRVNRRKPHRSLNLLAERIQTKSRFQYRTFADALDFLDDLIDDPDDYQETTLPSEYYKGLTSQERFILKYYYEEPRHTLKEIGELMGLSENRCSQILSNALFKLKERLCSRENAATLVAQ